MAPSGSSPSPQRKQPPSSSSSRRRNNSSSRDNSRSNNRAPARDPSDDQAVAIVSQQAHEHEWDQVNKNKGHEPQQEVEPIIEPQQRPRVSQGLVHNQKKADRRATRNLERQLFQEQEQRKLASKQPASSKHPDKSSSKQLKQDKVDKQQHKSDKQQKQRKKESNLGKFIGKQTHKQEEDSRELPPIGAPLDCTVSVACSALTTPSGLLSVAAGEEKYNSDDESQHKPLIRKNHRSSSDRLKHNSTSHKKETKSSSKRVGFNSNNNSNNNSSNNDRKNHRNGNGNNHHRSKGNGNGSTSDHSLDSSSAAPPALSMRKKNSKRPWFSSSSSFSKTNNNSNGRSYHNANTNVATTRTSPSGVQYRSATSTARALEELKRKKLEAQEKRRAVFILGVLFVVAVGVHYAGGSWTVLLGIGGAGAGGGSDASGLRGSRDKVYGDTKDLGYGGERSGALMPASKGAGGGASGSSGGNAAADEYEYKIPPPVEKEYDAEHEFLLPLKHFADVTDPIRPSDTSYFFHVPRAGGSTVKAVIGKCLKLVQSSEVGVRDGHGSDPQLSVLDVSESKYVNVDTTTIPGIQRAVDLGLAESALADVVVSSYLHESAALFDLKHQGRAFILLRDPIERATSMYWHRIKEVGDLDASVTIEDYAQGNGIENNWMCRFLANRMTGELTKDDLEQAKTILKDKFLVGFLDDLEESMYRVMKYNGWEFSEDETEQMQEEDCIRDLASEEGGSNKGDYDYEIPKRGSQAHALISWQTQFDAKLVTYAKELFISQTKEWGTKERKKMLKKEKKKKAGGR